MVRVCNGGLVKAGTGVGSGGACEWDKPNCKIGRTFGCAGEWKKGLAPATKKTSCCMAERNNVVLPTVCAVVGQRQASLRERARLIAGSCCRCVLWR